MLHSRYLRLINEMEELKWEIQNKQLDSVEILQLEEFKHVILLCTGGLDSPYEGYWFRIKIQWPTGYPYIPPNCTFLDKIWNPFVDFQKGQICMDILSDSSSPALTSIKIVLSLISLLSQNKISEIQDGFLNPTAAIQMLKNCPYFNQHARELCEKHSFKKKEIYTDNMRGVSQEHLVQVETHKIQQSISQNLASQKFHKKPIINQELQKEQVARVPEISVAEQPLLGSQNNSSQNFTNQINPLELSDNPQQEDGDYGRIKNISNKIKKIKKQGQMEKSLKEQIEQHRKKIRENLQKLSSKFSH